MAAGTRWVPNPPGIAAIGATAEVGEDLLELAEEAVERAQQIAPVDTGAFRDSIEATVGLEGAQQVASYGSDVPYAMYLEFGTSDTPVYATLRRAMEG